MRGVAEAESGEPVSEGRECGAVERRTTGGARLAWALSALSDRLRWCTAFGTAPPHMLHSGSLGIFVIGLHSQGPTGSYFKYGAAF